MLPVLANISQSSTKEKKKQSRAVFQQQSIKRVGLLTLLLINRSVLSPESQCE